MTASTSPVRYRRDQRAEHRVRRRPAQHGDVVRGEPAEIDQDLGEAARIVLGIAQRLFVGMAAVVSDS